jgi:hypothetical protein
LIDRLVPFAGALTATQFGNQKGMLVFYWPLPAQLAHLVYGRSVEVHWSVPIPFLPLTPV